MFDSRELFKKRFSAHMKETSRYLRYMFNGHIAVAMFFMISALAVYYQQWLAQLPKDYPSAWIIGIVFGLLVSYNPVRTLLKEPDLVFLITAEHKMSAYFRNTLVYSFVTQLYIILLVVAALGPLYFHAFPNRDGKMYLLILVVILIFKIWNLTTNWGMLKVRDVGVRRIDQVARLLLNCAVFFFIVNGHMLLAVITTILFILLFLYDLNISRKQAGLAWELLVEKDQNRMQLFYRIANMFTDVPHLKNRIKKRRWLVSFFNKIPFANKHTYDYLYRITFVRSGDYLGMYVRLIVIGGLLIYYVPNDWMKVIFALLFLYMSSFQMMTLYHHHRTIIWLDLYPVELNLRKEVVLKWLFQLAFIQTILFALVFLLMQDYLGFVIVLVGGTLFNMLFIKGYVKHKLE